MMDFCKKICIDCVHSELYQKRIRCDKGFFDTKLLDGILFTPLDFECLDFELKVLGDKNDSNGKSN